MTAWMTSGMASQPCAVLLREPVVVVVAGGNVGGEVDGRNRARGSDALRYADREELRDEGGRHRGDGPDADVAVEGDRGVAVRRQVVDDEVGDLAQTCAARVLGGDLGGVLEAGDRDDTVAVLLGRE